MGNVDAIETHELTKRYGDVLALDRLNLTVPTGLITGFLGPNGAGKSTTIALLLGLTRPSSGRVVFFGHEVGRQRGAMPHRLGALFEASALYPFLTVHENLAVQARLVGQPRQAADALLEQVGLTGRASAKASVLSLGQRQRLGLAVALIGRPQILLLDEPTNGLDPGGVRQIHRLLRDYTCDGGTVFFSSHRLEEVQHLCDRVAILRHGRLIAQGSVRDLLLQSPRQSILLRVDDPDRAAQLLGGRHAIERAEDMLGAFLRLKAGPLEAPIVNQQLVQAGLAVTELRPEVLTLEDLFLTLTEGADVSR